MEFKGKTVGVIVAENFATAEVFRKYGVDFCCHGDVDFEKACATRNVAVDAITKDLLQADDHVASHADFIHWPYDLLIDYILKIHHRGIRRVGPDMLELFDKVLVAHGEHHPELSTVKTLFTGSLQDLEIHLTKEEQILFPYLYSLFEAADEGKTIDAMHCGTVSNPISAMMHDHAAEGERYKEISRLTNGYQAPEDACNSYRLLLSQLKQFEYNLNEHIHLENNIVFPAAIRLEGQLQSNGQII